MRFLIVAADWQMPAKAGFMLIVIACCRNRGGLVATSLLR
jgi:hypothetical protein